MKKEPTTNYFPEKSADIVPDESRLAWNIWKKLTDFSEFLWDVYEHDFLTLAASEPPPGRCPADDLPF